MSTSYAKFKQAYDSLLEFIQKSANYRKRFKYMDSALQREFDAALELLQECERAATELLMESRKIAAIHLPNSPKIPNEFRNKLLDQHTFRQMDIGDMLTVFEFCEQRIEHRIEHLRFKLEGNPQQKKWIEPEILLLESYAVIANSLVHRLMEEIIKLRREEEVLQRDIEVLETLKKYAEKVFERGV